MHGTGGVKYFDSDVNCPLMSDLMNFGQFGNYTSLDL